MVVEEVINGSSEVLPDLVTDVIVEMGKVGKWLQALGLIVVLWIGFQIVALIINTKNRKRIKAMRSKMEEIDKKLSRIEKKLKK